MTQWWNGLFHCTRFHCFPGFPCSYGRPGCEGFHCCVPDHPVLRAGKEFREVNVHADTDIY